MQKKIETVFTPAIYDKFDDTDKIVVIVDILRATSTIVTAFENGISKIIPVSSIDKLNKYKNTDYLIAAENNGVKIDFADFGNSPDKFTREKIYNKTLVYSTTNGTATIQKPKNAYKIIIGAFLNINAIIDYIKKENKDCIILCAGWKSLFNIEDSLFAGSLAQSLLTNDNFYTICDSTKAAVDLWKVANEDLDNYVLKIAQKTRLAKLGLNEIIPYCFSTGISNKIPFYKNGTLII